MVASDRSTPRRRPSFAGFLGAGAVAAAANFGSRFAFSWLLPYEAAVVAAYGVGMLVAFLLMRHFVFDAGEGPWRRQAAWFSLVNLLAVLQTVAVSSLLARWALPALGVAQHREALAHALGVAVPVLSSWVGHRHASFRR
jgi:putative flippase GtrA